MILTNESQEKNIWTSGYLVDNIFNNLLENGYCIITKQNKYIDQIVNKFDFFRIGSPNVHIEIAKNDLDAETIKQIENCIQDCKTIEQKYRKLDGIFTEVIARITKLAEPTILSLKVNEDVVLLKRSLNEMRESSSFKWKLV